MGKQPDAPRARAIEQVLSELTGATSFSEVVERVLAIFPSKALDPAAGVRQAVRYEQVGKSVVFLDRQTIIPIDLALQGLRFRVMISESEAKQQVFSTLPSLLHLHNPELPLQALTFVDDSGRPILAPLAWGSMEDEDSAPGAFLGKSAVFDLRDWYRGRRAHRGDALLLTIEDWKSGRYRIDFEPAKTRQRHHSDIATSNQALADTLFALLEESAGEVVFLRQGIPTAYARTLNRDAYPADHWRVVLRNDPRMIFDDVMLRYAEARSRFDFLFHSAEQQPVTKSRKKRRSQAEAAMVYRFKASYYHRPSTWHRIEIQAGQTLADFDHILRTAFRHDHGDHLGGFWKLVRRGDTRRFREIDLGDVDPLGEGDAAGLCVDDLDLQPGAALKYVYDFGDWIEHRLDLEAIVEPEAGESYPRIVQK